MQRLLYWNRRNFLLDPDEELLEEDDDDDDENEAAKPAIPIPLLELLLEVVEELLEVPPEVDGILLIIGLVDLFWDDDDAGIWK